MRRKLCLCLLITVSLFSVSPAAAGGYTLSMLPRYSVEEIHRRIVPLARYLTKKTGLPVTPVVTSTFEQYRQQLLNGSITIGFENPYIYVLASSAHQAIALAEKESGGDRFRGIIIVRSDSPVTDIGDLEGKTISIVGKTSAGGYLSQKLTLQEEGIAPEKDCTLIEAADNKQENVILSVYTGDADAGFIRESALKKASAFIPPNALKVIARTAWLPNWALSVSRTMDPEDQQKILSALLSLSANDPASRALKIARFRKTSDREYDVVRQAAGLPKRRDSLGSPLSE